MKRIRRGYCSFCSTEKEDERDLVIENKIIKCRNCGAEQMFIPEDENTPFHYLGEVVEDDRRRIRE